MKFLAIIASLFIVSTSGFRGPTYHTGLKSKDCAHWVEWMETNSHELIVLPHESDCSRWYECHYGIFSEHQCSKGSRFDPFGKGCVSKNNIDCIKFLDYSEMMEKRVGRKYWMVHYR